MMGRGADGGIPSGQVSHFLSDRQKVAAEMDIYSQAVKALALKSPFGGEESGGGAGPGSGYSGPLVKLPSSGDPKRKNRARKTQAVSKKRNYGDMDDENPRKFWSQMEDYFREITADDIRLLFPRTSFTILDSNRVEDPSFFIRPLGRRFFDIWVSEYNRYKMQACAINVEHSTARGIKRKLLTATPSSKRKKAFITNSTQEALIQTSVISPPDPEEEVLCHVCNLGDNDPSNQIIFCELCNVTVHQDCYGVQAGLDGQWSCFSCASHGIEQDAPYNCVLCPLKGGALKPVAGGDQETSSRRRFAHLFCAQWIPETFIPDPMREPVGGVENINEERWKLLCDICNEKHGVCIHCSHGPCTTSFHPSCARDAKLWMEVSESEDALELRAYCQKHTAVRLGKASAGIKEDEKVKDTQNNVAFRDSSSPESQNNGSCELDQGQLITNLKEVAQHVPIETVATEANIPQQSLLLWLEGKLSEGVSKINTSISSWLHTWKNGYSKQEEEHKKENPNDIGQVQTNCQVLQAEDEFSYEAEDRSNSSPVDVPINLMQNDSRLFETGSPCLVITDDHAESNEADKQSYVAPQIIRRLQGLQEDIFEAHSGGCSPESTSLDEQWEQLKQAKELGVLDWFPQDEIEAEIVILQNQLIDCALANRSTCERLLSRVLCQLSGERQAARKQMQDLLVVSQFLADQKEARKQNRRERRDREAQAVLAAATAAAAASPRTGYVKRDNATNEESSEYKPNQGTPQSPYVRPFKPPVPKPPRLNVSSSFRAAQCRNSAVHSQEDHTPCDICSNTDSIRPNKIIQCARCNVAVHQECYGVSRIPSGLWFCQPCAEFQQTQPIKMGEENNERVAPGVQCALCPNASGAFKRSSDGRWVHVFCALWLPNTTFGKEQTSPIGGLDTVPADQLNLVCSICQQQHGACIKCNFGHCYSAFHPMCAREVGLYMNVRYINGKTSYRAYCERHSPQQRIKTSDHVSPADLKQTVTPDEINVLRQIRVEFERVRLICERICRRERIKRELTHCVKDLYIAQLAAATAGHSSDNVTNHQREYEGNGSVYSDTHLLDVPWMAESSVWPHPKSGGGNVKEITWSKPKEQPPESTTPGKDHRRPKKYTRHSEPLGREKIMTPSEAHMHNKLLPKGYAYVPVDMLEKGTSTLKQQAQHQQQDSQNMLQNQHQNMPQNQHHSMLHNHHPVQNISSQQQNMLQPERID